MNEEKPQPESTGSATPPPGGQEPNPGPPPASPPPERGTGGGRDRATNQWAMFIHFSVLASWLVPLAGIVVPVMLWQLKKDELPGIVPHAHVVLNWIVSSFVYCLICFLLLFVVIGVFGFFLLALVTVVYSLVGGVKANEGELWEYPGTIIKIFKV